MTIRNLEIFLEVVRTGSMSLAAQNLYISQPTVSHAIGALEKEFNTQLFDRSPNMLSLTQTGSLLEQEAHKVIQAIEHLNESLRMTEETAPINLGASVTVAASILDDLVAKFKEEHPQVPIKTLISNTSDIEDAMTNNLIDIAIVSGKIRNSAISCTNVIEDYQVCVCRNDHPFAERSEVSLEELCSENFYMLLGTRWTSNTFVQYVHDKGYSINIVSECSNTALLKDQLMKNGGVTVISLRVVKKEIESGQLCVIPCEGCTWDRSFVLAYRKNKYLTVPMRDLIELTGQFSKDDDLEKLLYKGGMHSVQ